MLQHLFSPLTLSVSHPLFLNFYLHLFPLSPPLSMCLLILLTFFFSDIQNSEKIYNILLWSSTRLWFPPFLLLPYHLHHLLLSLFFSLLPFLVTECDSVVTASQRAEPVVSPSRESIICTQINTWGPYRRPAPDLAGSHWLMSGLCYKGQKTAFEAVCAPVYYAPVVNTKMHTCTHGNSNILHNHISANVFAGPVWKIHLSTGEPISLSLNLASTVQ